MGKRLWTGLLLAFCVLAAVTAGTEVSAAKKNQLVEVKATAKEQAKGYTVRYKYYNAKGKVIKNKWQSVTVDGVKEKMYFGSDGKAYQAPSEYMFLNNVKLFKIGGVKYGFDVKGRMVKGYASTAGFMDTSYYFFDSKGKYNASKSKKFAAAVEKALKSNAKTLLKMLGTPESMKEIDICLGSEWTGELYTFNDLVQVQIKKKVSNGKRMALSVTAAQEGL